MQAPTPFMVVALVSCIGAGCSSGSKASQSVLPLASSHKVNGENPVAEYKKRKARQAEQGVDLFDISGLRGKGASSIICVDFGSRCMIDYDPKRLSQNQVAEGAVRICKDEASVVQNAEDNSINNERRYEFECLLSQIANRPKT